jgi:molybdenum cofactor guanylyltransferase
VAPSKPTCCAVILAGGLNTRMRGRNKAFLEVGGRTILDRLIETLQSFFDEILLVTREPALYADKPLRVVEDVYEARASLTGIHSGLFHMRADFALVVPCDLPFIEPAFIRILLAEVTPQVDAVVPTSGRFYEPLCAVYAKSCLAPIRDQLERGDYKISRFFDRIRLKTIPIEDVLSPEDRMRSFFNVNTPDALAASRALVEEEDESSKLKDER